MKNTIFPPDLGHFNPSFPADLLDKFHLDLSHFITLGFKHKCFKYSKENYWFDLDQHFSFKYFLKDPLVTIILSKIVRAFLSTFLEATNMNGLICQTGDLFGQV